MVSAARECLDACLLKSSIMANWLRRCHECNFPLGKKDLFCPRCGAKQRREKVASSVAATNDDMLGNHQRPG